MAVTPPLMEIVVAPDGVARCVYAEHIDLARLGEVGVSRASHVEPDASGQWTADLSPVGGPVLGPFDRRSDALTAETKWLAAHWLTPASCPMPSSQHPLKGGPDAGRAVFHDVCADGDVHRLSGHLPHGGQSRPVTKQPGRIE